MKRGLFRPIDALPPLFVVVCTGAMLLLPGKAPVAGKEHPSLFWPGAAVAYADSADSSSGGGNPPLPDDPVRPHPPVPWDF